MGRALKSCVCYLIDRLAAEISGLLLAKQVTCCAVSILSFSISSIWKPLSSTSSVDAGTVAVKVDCRDRVDRLHKSSMGNCNADQGSLFLNVPISLRMKLARRTASSSASPANWHSR